MALERLYARNCYRLRMTVDGNEIDELFADRQYGSPAKAYQAAKSRETELANPAPATKAKTATRKAAAKPAALSAPPAPPAKPATVKPAPGKPATELPQLPAEDMHFIHLRTYTGARDGQMVHEFLVRLPVPAGAETLVPGDYAVNARKEICEVFSITRLGAVEAVKRARDWRDEMGRLLYCAPSSPTVAAGELG